jgi:hypothetical protein
MPAPPIFRDDGAIFCRRHEDAPAKWRCTHCRETLCDRCLHRLRRRKGQALLLCPLCSHPCEPIGGQPKPKKSILDTLFKTVKLPRLRRRPPAPPAGA